MEADLSSSCLLTIGKSCIELQCNSSHLAERLRRQYQQFLSNDSAHLTVTVDWRNQSGIPASASLPFTFVDGQPMITTDRVKGMISIEHRAASIYLDVSNPLEVVDYFMRVVVALLLFQEGGLMIHAAGIVRNGKAYVFFGHSGSGKTTVARLSSHDVVLNDDLIALLPEEQTWRVYATPFSNPTQVSPTCQNAPLVGLYRLNQASQVWIESLSTARGLAELISSVPVISADPTRSRLLMQRCYQLLTTAPCYNLYFLPDASFWQVVEDAN